MGDVFVNPELYATLVAKLPADRRAMLDKLEDVVGDMHLYPAWVLNALLGPKPVNNKMRGAIVGFCLMNEWPPQTLVNWCKYKGFLRHQGSTSDMAQWIHNWGTGYMAKKHWEIYDMELGHKRPCTFTDCKGYEDSLMHRVKLADFNELGEVVREFWAYMPSGRSSYDDAAKDIVTFGERNLCVDCDAPDPTRWAD